MGLGGFNKMKAFLMAGLSFLAVSVTAVSTFAWFQINYSLSPSSTVQTNGMRTDAFVYQNQGRAYDDTANKAPTTDASGTLTFDHSQGQAATSYYIMGNGSLWSGDYVASSGIQMYKNPNNPNDKGTYWKISLAVGDTFKIFNSEGSYNIASYWYGYSSISSSCSLKGTNFTDSNTNIYVAVAGVYDIFINIQNVISIQYHSDTRFAADTTNEIGYLIVGSGSDWNGDYDMGEGISMTINKRSDSGIDKAMYAGLRLAAGDSFRVVDGSSSQDDPTYYPTDNSDSNLAPRTSGAAATNYFSYSATDGNYTFTCRKTAYYCIYLNASSCVNIQLWDGKATDGSTYYTRGANTIGEAQTNSVSPKAPPSANPKNLASSGTQTIYFKDATWWSGNNSTGTTYAYFWEEDYLYFVPNSSWKSDGARFAVYCDNGTWIDLTETSTSGVYSCGFPSDNKIVFARMNGSTSANNWDNKWNQTPTGDGRITISRTNNKWTMALSGYDGASVSPSTEHQENAAFPGVQMTRVSPASFSTSEPNVYSYSYNASIYKKVIFSRKNNSGVDAQTNDITLSDSGANNMYDISNSSAAWVGNDNKVTGSWTTLPSAITLTFTASYGDDTDPQQSITIAYGGTGTAPSFANHYGYTKPTVWTNGSQTIAPGATISYSTASAYATKAFTATYSTSNTTFYLDLYALKYNNQSGFSNSPTFKIYAWDASGNKEYGSYGSAGFPASPITTGVIQPTDSSAAASYDPNANYDYRYCFWTVTLPSTVTGYIVYTGTNIGSTTWKSADIGVSNNLAILATDGSVTYRNDCSGDVRTVTTVKVMGGDQTTLYKYNLFDHISWTVPSAGDETGHSSKWYSNATGTGGTEYEAGSSISITTNKTIYCIYSPISYTLLKVLRIYRGTSYAKDGETTNQSLVYNTATSVTSVSYAGATFVGWYSDPSCTSLLSTKNDGSYKYTIGAANATIYAKFTLNTATLRGTYNYLAADGTVDHSSSGTATVYVEDSLAISGTAVYNETALANALNPSITSGYYLEGWYSNSPMTTGWSNQTVTASNAGGYIDLYAKITPAKVYLYGSSDDLGTWNYQASDYSKSAGSTVSFTGVVLAKGDQLKTYSPNGSSNQKSFPYDSGTAAYVTGSAITNGFVDINSGDQHNIRVQLAGTYTITLTMNAGLNVTAISIVATALAASNFSVDFGINGMSASPTFSGSGSVFTTTFHAYIGDTFRFKTDYHTSADTHTLPAITNGSGDPYEGLEIASSYIRCDIDADITITFTANLSSFGSSTCAVSEVQEYSIVYAAGEHEEFDTATYFIQTADDSSFTQGVSFVTMHYPVDTTNYHAVYTGYTLSFSENHNHRYMRVLQRVSNISGSADSAYQHVFIPGASRPTEICSVSGRTYDFTAECVLDIKVHKAVSDEAYLEVTLSQATSQSATTHYSDIYLIGLGKPGSDIRDGDYTTDHGIRMHTYGGNTSNFPAYIGDTEYTSSEFDSAVAARTVGSGVTLMAGDVFTLTDGTDTFGPSSNGTGYTVSSGKVTITQSAIYYIWATSTSSVVIAQKTGSVISDGRTADDIAIDNAEDWFASPLSYTRENGARVLNASGSSLNFGGKLDYSLFDGCGDGYYHFYVELRNISTSTSGTVSYGFSNLSIPTGTKIKYANAVQNSGSTLSSGFNAATIANLSNETTLSSSTSITNSTVTANENGFAGSTLIEVMIPISQIATSSTFDFAFTVVVSYQETIS